MITRSPASASIADCLCRAGFYEETADSCVACGYQGQGTSSSLEEYYCLTENAVIARCQEMSVPNFHKAENEASVPSDCLCKAGYFRVSDFDTCKPCPRNHYCPEVTSNIDTLPNIESCPQNAITEDVGADSSALCYCEVGFKLQQDDESATCLACGVSHLCAVGSVDGDEITDCGSTSNTQPSEEHSACECKAGFKTISDVQAVHVCAACEAGKVQTLPGQFSCDACGVGFFVENANQA